MGCTSGHWQNHGDPECPASIVKSQPAWRQAAVSDNNDCHLFSGTGTYNKLWTRGLNKTENSPEAGDWTKLLPCHLVVGSVLSWVSLWSNNSGPSYGTGPWWNVYITHKRTDKGSIGQEEMKLKTKNFFFKKSRENKIPNHILLIKSTAYGFVPMRSLL